MRIFISYRRDDSLNAANGINDGLSSRLPTASIFMDLDSIPAGTDFIEQIERFLESCDTVLVLIGPQWLGATDAAGRRRLDDPSDYVRAEVASALASTARVFPVILDGAQMPSARDLPEDLAPLARINAFELAQRRWRGDMDHLASLIHDADTAGRGPRSHGRGRTLGLAALAVLVLALGGIAAVSLTRDDASEPSESVSAGSSATLATSSVAGTATRTETKTQQAPAEPPTRRFLSPSRNIACSVSARSARCTVLADGTTFVVASSGAGKIGQQAVSSAGPGVQSGSTVKVGGLRCRIPAQTEARGIICTNADGGGFEASRVPERQRTF